ncbi:phosphonate ABC transporter ATP-binding protein [Desulfobacula phenolica]|uniref:Phosphonate transport system ATP-binding protein n=1 Tax=Desulfobacula phenolica TaxID=90732 RepID=A0A1H2ECR3_9BACT|nr:phosphonate ABC transporter ATP-binding protein [Desulfobacula phenolica]SDT92870.1 phosphonate transport system ATP-binding protein [Desulfobacula phenolica]
MILLEVKNLSFRYHKTGPEILKNISFNLAPNDFLAIIGPSGAGKSTLLRCINRLLEPTSGDILFDGINITNLHQRGMRDVRCRMGMIFQEFNLIERMSVIDNVLAGRLGYTSSIRSIFKMFPKSDIQKALKILDRVGLSNFVEKRPTALSGGQRQRVGIARALMQDPKLLLVDEPTSSLDPKISREVMGIIKTMSEEEGVPVLCSIHDVILALEFSNKVIGLQDGYKRLDSQTNSIENGMLDEIYAL